MHHGRYKYSIHFYESLVLGVLHVMVEVLLHADILLVSKTLVLILEFRDQVDSMVLSSGDNKMYDFEGQSSFQGLYFCTIVPLFCTPL